MIDKGEWQWSENKAFYYRCGRFGTKQCWNREKCFEVNGYFKRRRGEVLIVCEVEDLSKGKADNILGFKVEQKGD